MSSSMPLDYAPPPPLHHRHSFRRWILFAFLFGVGAIAVWCGPAVWNRGQLLYWQHRCLIYTASNDHVEIIDKGRATSRSIPLEWSRFYSLLSPPGSNSDGTVFLHEMKKRNGERRLVAVDIVAGRFLDNSFLPRAHVVIPGSITRLPSEVPFTGIVGSSSTSVGPDKVTLFAGTIDSGDSSRFTFHIDVQGRTITYDGWLRDDDVVVINQHPAKN